MSTHSVAATLPERAGWSAGSPSWTGSCQYGSPPQMALGLLACHLVPGPALNAVAIDGVSLPIALGLLVMMYPVLACATVSPAALPFAHPTRLGDSDGPR